MNSIKNNTIHILTRKYDDSYSNVTGGQQRLHAGPVVDHQVVTQQQLAQLHQLADGVRHRAAHLVVLQIQ